MRKPAPKAKAGRGGKARSRRKVSDRDLALAGVDDLLARFKALRSPTVEVRAQAFLGLPHPDDLEIFFKALLLSPLSLTQMERKVDALLKEAVPLVLSVREGEEPAFILAVEATRHLKVMKDVLAQARKGKRRGK